MCFIIIIILCTYWENTFCYDKKGIFFKSINRERDVEKNDFFCLYFIYNNDDNELVCLQ